MPDGFSYHTGPKTSTAVMGQGVGGELH